MLIKVITICMITITAVISQDKCPIEIKKKAEDIVCSRLCYYLNEKIAASNLLRISVDEEPRFMIIIVPMDLNDVVPKIFKTKGNTIAMAIAWVIISKSNPYPIYVTHTIQFCGSNSTEEVAELLLSYTINYTKEFKDLLE